MVPSFEAVSPERARLSTRSAGLLARWHLLSLDAPTVTAVWTWFIARAVGLWLPWTEIAAMFVAVWVLYAADRLLDARGMGSGTVPGLEARHLFHHAHRVWFRWGIVAACLTLAALLPTLLWEEVKLYLVLGSLLVGWFLIIHTAGRVGARALPKEFVVGVFFAAAVFIPTVARVPAMRAALLLPALLAGTVCWLNCLFIFAWEHEGDLARQAHTSTRLAAAYVVWLGCALVGITAGLVWVVPLDLRWIVAAAGASAGLLVLLHGARARVEATTLRALADVALLTPLLAGLWLR